MLTQSSPRTIMALLCTLALVLAVTGCKKESETEEQPTEEKPTVSEPNTTPEVTKEPEEKTVEEPEETPEVTSPPAKTETPPVVEETLMKIMPLTGVGPVTFGMSKQQVIQALGQPDESEHIMMLYLQSKGLSVTFRSGGVNQINCYSKQYPTAPPQITTFRGKTEEGIGMGISKQKIISAYGQPDSIQNPRGMEMLTYSRLHTNFILVDDKLVCVQLRAP